ncbi:MAG: WbqC family protein [Bacteroidia bacterium]|nr:WbqC family protein [Bacteroidia bacterium]
MDKSVLPLFLFPKVGWWQEAIRAGNFILEVSERWVKQSERSRFDIAGPNGRQSLSIPTVKKTRTILNEVEISYDDKWDVLHWRSLETAYNRSPYFEFYKDDIQAIFEARHTRLVDLSLDALIWCNKALGTDLKMEQSVEYSVDYRNDFRKSHFDAENHAYYQVFHDRNEFLPNLSILDVLCNCGPEALSMIR